MNKERDALLKIAFDRYHARMAASGGKASAEGIFTEGFVAGWEARAVELKQRRPKWARE